MAWVQVPKNMNSNANKQKKTFSFDENPFCNTVNHFYFGADLRHHYRVRNWTFDKKSLFGLFLKFLLNGSSGENRVQKFSFEVGIKV